MRVCVCTDSSGGSTFISGTGNVTISSAVFSGNRVRRLTNSSEGPTGGAVYIEAPSRTNRSSATILTIRDSAFVDNSATVGRGGGTHTGLSTHTHTHTVFCAAQNEQIPHVLPSAAGLACAEGLLVQVHIPEVLMYACVCVRVCVQRGGAVAISSIDATITLDNCDFVVG